MASAHLCARREQASAREPQHPRSGRPHFCHGYRQTCRRSTVAFKLSIVAAIEKHARGDVEALARGIIEELRVAGLEIRRTDAIPAFGA
jgi:hypothetical protein